MIYSYAIFANKKIAVVTDTISRQINREHTKWQKKNENNQLCQMIEYCRGGREGDIYIVISKHVVEKLVTLWSKWWLRSSRIWLKRPLYLDSS